MGWDGMGYESRKQSGAGHTPPPFVGRRQHNKLVYLGKRGKTIIRRRYPKRRLTSDQTQTAGQPDPFSTLGLSSPAL
jgi:hypothetical protein